MFRAPTNVLSTMMPPQTCPPFILKMQGNRGSPLKVNCWKPAWLGKTTITSPLLRKNLLAGTSICAIKALIPYNDSFRQATWATPLSFALLPNATTPHVLCVNMAGQSNIPLNPSAIQSVFMKKDELYPGQQVSMDHFKVTQPGHLYTSMGKTQPDMMYSGGCIFVDHATGFTHAEHLINFTTMDTIHPKQ